MSKLSLLWTEFCSQ